MRPAVIGFIVLIAVGLLALWWLTRPAAAMVEVYFVRAQGDAGTVVAAQRPVAIPRLPGLGSPLGAAVRLALQELLEGPTAAEGAAGLTTAIPEGTRLLGVRVAGGVVYADFSADVESGGGSASMLARLWQIVYTATQDPMAPRVRVLINGQERQAMGGEGVIIDHPIERPAAPPIF